MQSWRLFWKQFHLLNTSVEYFWSIYKISFSCTGLIKRTHYNYSIYRSPNIYFGIKHKFVSLKFSQKNLPKVYCLKLFFIKFSVRKFWILTGIDIAAVYRQDAINRLKKHPQTHFNVRVTVTSLSKLSWLQITESSKNS